jgi:hypothetical protein
MLRLSIHQRYLHHAWKVITFDTHRFDCRGLLLALMPSLRQWQLSPTTQTIRRRLPASYNSAVRRAAPPW